ncbi:MAG: adenosylcobinamide-GDP ribazoletransferase [Desulfobacterales bacterium]|nr:adenosylcobinamide-GDP ribazoletransferase [Desulfobacterales bacterium]
MMRSESLNNVRENFIAALQFITILPAGKTPRYKPREMIAYFPLIGLLIGMLLALFDALVSLAWSPAAASVLDIILLAVLTGALHLDGLGDTADGLLGHRPRERALEIMKDSRIGAMGLVAVIGCLAMKWAGISGIAENRFLFLMLVPAWSRAGMLFGIKYLPYGRPEGGTGHALFNEPLKWIDFRLLLPLMILTLITGRSGIGLLLTFFILTTVLIGYFGKRMGCITGDMLGCMTEVLEAGLFLAVSAG